MNNAVDYVGKDLESMSFAVNYHKWILDEFRPFLGSRVVEVGAGTGSFSELLASECPRELCLVEPSEMFEALSRNPKLQGSSNTAVGLYNGLFESVAEEIRETVKPDSIMYVNVLEHVEHDNEELRLVHQTLSPGGRCFVFVPALTQLYGRFDEKIGHFRRYTRTKLEQQCKDLGFKILRSTYFDSFGIIPWFIKYRLFGSDTLEPRMVEHYDKVIVPFLRKIEQTLPVPVGKNILLVAEK